MLVSGYQSATGQVSFTGGIWRTLISLRGAPFSGYLGAVDGSARVWYFRPHAQFV